MSKITSIDLTKCAQETMIFFLRNGKSLAKNAKIEKGNIAAISQEKYESLQFVSPVRKLQTKITQQTVSKIYNINQILQAYVGICEKNYTH